MARAADTGGAGGVPFIKLANIGDKFTGASGHDVRACQRQQRKFKTGELLWKDDVDKDGNRKKLLEEVAYFVLVSTDGGYIGNREEGTTSTPEPGDHVRFSFKGFTWGKVIDARKALPAYSGFPAGQPCSGDIYTVELVSRSKATDNPAAATRAGFTVVENRIVLATQEEFERWAVTRIKSGQDTNAAADLAITVRRPAPNEKRWEQAADALFDSKPWAKEPATVGGGGGGSEDLGDDEPFVSLHTVTVGGYRNMVEVEPWL